MTMQYVCPGAAGSARNAFSAIHVAYVSVSIAPIIRLGKFGAHWFKPPVRQLLNTNYHNNRKRDEEVGLATPIAANPIVQRRAKALSWPP